MRSQVSVRTKTDIAVLLHTYIHEGYVSHTKNFMAIKSQVKAMKIKSETGVEGSHLQYSKDRLNITPLPADAFNKNHQNLTYVKFKYDWN